jgi:hypothetical protein
LLATGWSRSFAIDYSTCRNRGLRGVVASIHRFFFSEFPAPSLSIRTSPESDKGHGALKVSIRLCAEAVDLLMLKTNSPLPVRFAKFGS